MYKNLIKLNSQISTIVVDTKKQTVIHKVMKREIRARIMTKMKINIIATKNESLTSDMPDIVLLHSKNNMMLQIAKKKNQTGIMIQLKN